MSWMVGEPTAGWSGCRSSEIHLEELTTLEFVRTDAVQLFGIYSIASARRNGAASRWRG